MTRTSDRPITGHTPLLTELLGLGYECQIIWAFICYMRVNFSEGSAGGRINDVGASINDIVKEPSTNNVFVSILTCIYLKVDVFSIECMGAVHK